MMLSLDVDDKSINVIYLKTISSVSNITLIHVKKHFFSLSEYEMSYCIKSRSPIICKLFLVRHGRIELMTSAVCLVLVDGILN